MEQANFNYSPLVNQIRSNVIEEAKNSQHIDPWFLPFHLFEVERFANELCDKYLDSDRDVVGLAVWLHDIGRLRGKDEDHDIFGAEEAKRVLEKEDYPSAKVSQVYDACQSHRCKDIKPVSIESKILATADAMSHFTHGFYLRLFHHFCKEKSYEEVREFIKNKLIRDFEDKIAFNEGREEVKDRYDALLLVLEE